jgi:hypothetical protein
VQIHASPILLYTPRMLTSQQGISNVYTCVVDITLSNSEQACLVYRTAHH